MKTFEKLILCCIWICIAIVMVLIKDQVDLNQMMKENAIQVPELKISDKTKQVVLDEVAAMSFLGKNLSILNDAEIQFYEDGTVELSVSVTESMIEEVKKRVDSDVVEFILPVLKGTEISCKAEVNSELIDVKICQAGVMSIPQSFMGIMNEKVNEMWGILIADKGIRGIEVHEDGLIVTLQQE